MIVECCAQERSYIKFFGLLAQRFCQVNREFQDRFVDSFAEQVGVAVLCLLAASARRLPVSRRL